MKRIIIIIGFIFLATSLYAHSREGHTKDWVACLGIDVQASKDLTEVWKEIQNGIDVYEDDYQSLRNNHPWFKIRGHRLLFHWGMNNDPKNHRPLTYKIEENLRDYFESEDKIKYLTSGELKNEDLNFLKRFDIPAELLTKSQSNEKEESRKAELKKVIYSKLNSIKQDETSALLNDLRKMQGERNRKMINCMLKHFFGNNSAFRQDGAALATLVYDIHILGDYSTTDNLPLQEIDGVNGVLEDIIERGLKRLVSKNYNNSIVQKFRKQANDSGFQKKERKAYKILETLKEFLPQILWHERHKTLANNRIIIKEPVIKNLY